MIIREAKNTDSENIKKVFFTVLKEYDLDPAPKVTDNDLDAIEKHYSNNCGYFGIIEKKLLQQQVFTN